MDREPTTAHLRLTEAEVDAAIADPRAGWQCDQGRGRDWPMPAEIPSFKSGWTWFLLAVIVVITIAGSALIDGYTAAEVLHWVGL